MCTQDEVRQIVDTALADFREVSEKKRKARDAAGYAGAGGALLVLPLIWALDTSVSDVSRVVQENQAQIQHELREAGAGRSQLERDFISFQTQCTARETRYGLALNRLEAQQTQLRQEIGGLKSTFERAAITTDAYQQRMTQLVSDLRGITSELQKDTDESK
jgi:hypothetical protein